MTNSVDPDQTAPILFAYILKFVMLGNYLQQSTSVDVIFRCILSWRFKNVISLKYMVHSILLTIKTTASDSMLFGFLGTQV